MRQALGKASLILGDVYEKVLFCLRVGYRPIYPEQKLYSDYGHFKWEVRAAPWLLLFP